ncbi:rRNA maturation RNase YbeY [Fodinibius sp. Rm-B-1B1-1]|uniref:rRNA maturation RNase YbeY n=1 Tax=Fodinibius alkaliphilus TaxID=3140241 RepID=UPI00315A7EE5
MAESTFDIQVFNQTDAPLPFDEHLLSDIAQQIADHEECSFNFVEVVYVDEAKIIEINKEHLDRDYVTDIISFRYDDAETNDNIEGTLFCCAPRIKEQAHEFDESEQREFLRIYIHGLLHLVGYDDQSQETKEQMTGKENFYLHKIEDLLSS